MKLYLLRHGHATNTLRDPGLSEEGAETIRRMSAHLARVAEPKEILHSTKRRARETAEILAAALDVPIREVKGLAPHDAVVDVVEEMTFAPDDTMIVSHLPYLDRLLDALVFPHGGGQRLVLTPGSAMCLERSETKPGDATWWIRWFVSPDVMP